MRVCVCVCVCVCVFPWSLQLFASSLGIPASLSGASSKNSLGTDTNDTHQQMCVCVGLSM